MSEQSKNQSIQQVFESAIEPDDKSANTPETDIEKSEACEGLRALDIGMDVYTFALDNEYTPVDVIEQYEIVCKKMIDDKFLSLYSKKV